MAAPEQMQWISTLQQTKNKSAKNVLHSVFWLKNPSHVYNPLFHRKCFFTPSVECEDLTQWRMNLRLLVFPLSYSNFLHVIHL